MRIFKLKMFIFYSCKNFSTFLVLVNFLYVFSPYKINIPLFELKLDSINPNLILDLTGDIFQFYQN